MSDLVLGKPVIQNGIGWPDGIHPIVFMLQIIISGLGEVCMLISIRKIFGCVLLIFLVLPEVSRADFLGNLLNNLTSNNASAPQAVNFPTRDQAMLQEIQLEAQASGYVQHPDRKTVVISRP